MSPGGSTGLLFVLGVTYCSPARPPRKANVLAQVAVENVWVAVDNHNDLNDEDQNQDIEEIANVAYDDHSGMPFVTHVDQYINLRLPSVKPVQHLRTYCYSLT